VRELRVSGALHAVVPALPKLCARVTSGGLSRFAASAAWTTVEFHMARPSETERRPTFVCRFRAADSAGVKSTGNEAGSNAWKVVMTGESLGRAPSGRVSSLEVSQAWP